LNTAPATYPNPAALNDNVKLATYLEFDPILNSVVLTQFDSALAGYAFDVTKQGSYYNVVTLAPPNYSGSGAVSSRRPVSPGPRPSRAQRAAASLPSMPADSTAFIFVNGIRSLWSGAFAVNTQLITMLAEFPDLVSSHTVLFYNANLHGEWRVFADPALGCDGRATIDTGRLHLLRAAARWVTCKMGGFVSGIAVDDILFSILEFPHQHWSALIPTLEDPDSDKLAQVVSKLHWKNQNTIVVAHSQGNMVFRDALPRIAAYDSLLSPDLRRCTGLVSFAAPLNQGDFRSDPTWAVDTAVMRGTTVKGDLLLLLHLPNDFPPPGHSVDSLSALADSDYASAPAWRKPLVPWKWGKDIHDVQDNYFAGSLRSLTADFLHQTYQGCNR
jgi:hypothetical protein